MVETISIASGNGRTFEAYVAVPDRTPAPIVVVMGSVYGVTDGLKDTLERYAARGVISVAPDPFWRTFPGPLPESRREEAQGRLKDYDYDDGLDDALRSRDAAAVLAEWNGKFAVLGFCFGGNHAYFALTRADADAGVAFHPTRIQKHLDEASKIDAPFSFHFGEFDPLAPLDEVAKIEAALAGKPGEIVVHPGANHGFARRESSNYDPSAASDSEERAFAMLGPALGIVVPT